MIHPTTQTLPSRAEGATSSQRHIIAQHREQDRGIERERRRRLYSLVALVNEKGDEIHPHTSLCTSNGLKIWITNHLGIIYTFPHTHTQSEGSRHAGGAQKGSTAKGRDDECYPHRHRQTLSLAGVLCAVAPFILVPRHRDGCGERRLIGLSSAMQRRRRAAPYTCTWCMNFYF